MKEFVAVEFLFAQDDMEKVYGEVQKLGEDFQSLGTEINSSETDRYFMHNSRLWFRITGRIDSATATMIKLSNKFLSDRMRVSYISDELKDRYRK